MWSAANRGRHLTGAQAPIWGRRHHAPPQPRGAMVLGQDGGGPHAGGMAPSLIREHLFHTRTLRVRGAGKQKCRSDPPHSDTDPERYDSPRSRGSCSDLITSDARLDYIVIFG